MNNSENKATEQKPEIVVATQWNGNDVEFEKCTNCGALHEGDHVCNPDKVHFDKMLLKELVWKLDREVWAHVQNPSPSEEWSTSKAREETRKLISEYIGNYDALQSENQALRKQNEELVELVADLKIMVSDSDQLKAVENKLKQLGF